MPLRPSVYGSEQPTPRCVPSVAGAVRAAQVPAEREEAVLQPAHADLLEAARPRDHLVAVEVAADDRVLVRAREPVQPRRRPCCTTSCRARSRRCRPRPCSCEAGHVADDHVRRRVAGPHGTGDANENVNVPAPPALVPKRGDLDHVARAGRRRERSSSSAGRTSRRCTRRARRPGRSSRRRPRAPCRTRPDRRRRPCTSPRSAPSTGTRRRGSRRRRAPCVPAAAAELLNACGPLPVTRVGVVHVSVPCAAAVAGGRGDQEEAQGLGTNEAGGDEPRRGGALAKRTCVRAKPRSSLPASKPIPLRTDASGGNPCRFAPTPGL